MSKILVCFYVAVIGTCTLSAMTYDSDFLTFKTTGGTLMVVEHGPMEGVSEGSYSLYAYGSGGRFISGSIMPRNGTINKVWVSEKRHNCFDVYIWMVSAGSGSYGTLDRYSFEANRFVTLPELPMLKGSLANGYMGHDIFYLNDGNIYRSFPVYTPADTNANPTGGRRCLRFNQKAMTWTLSQQCTD